MQDPGLAPDSLDHVVSVEGLKRLEVVEGTAGAAGAAHVDVHDSESELEGDRSNRALATPRAVTRVGIAVAGILDQGRIGPASRRSLDVDGQLRSVTRAQIAVAAARQALVVDVRVRRRRAVAQNPEGGRLRSALATLAHAVARAGLDVPEDDPAERSRLAGVGDLAVAVEEAVVGPRRGAGDVHLLDAAAGGEAGGAGSGGRDDRAPQQQQHRRRQNPPCRRPDAVRRRLSHRGTLFHVSQIRVGKQGTKFGRPAVIATITRHRRGSFGAARGSACRPIEAARNHRPLDRLGPAAPPASARRTWSSSPTASPSPGSAFWRWP